MLKIDAHQHFWRFDPVRDSWINDDMKRIRKDFLPCDLEPVLKHNGIDGCVVVQSDQSTIENIFQLNNGFENDFIKGVVGWVDLQAADIEAQLDYWANFKKLKGFRHILQGEKDRALMLKRKFKNGIGLLSKYNFTYDILILPDQLQYAVKLATTFPQQKFVIDHIAKPLIKSAKINDWKKDMESFSSLDNVYCKVSGLVTEADWENWKQKDMHPYLDVVVETFGMKRLMYGSDWPVCLLAASYKKVLGICHTYFKSFSQSEKDGFYGGNAIAFYNL